MRSISGELPPKLITENMTQMDFSTQSEALFNSQTAVQLYDRWVVFKVDSRCCTWVKVNENIMHCQCWVTCFYVPLTVSRLALAVFCF